MDKDLSKHVLDDIEDGFNHLMLTLFLFGLAIGASGITIGLFIWWLIKFN